jgi:ABC-type polysaccharide/polyol phosphate transport system ATPase subunit
MNDVAIRVEGLSKRYRLGSRKQTYQTLRDSLSRAVTAPFRRGGTAHTGRGNTASETPQTLWALKDVSLNISRGEFVAIIGGNGAGKSTLLKILSRVTEPTTGFVELHGRIGSLLEVGMGFHAELTGRENVYLSGAILGMKKAEIDRKFSSIVDFSELSDFIDTPVKHYSTGMYVRLGFAVAVHLEPEILLVDEVLAVGDVQFATKCEQKMRALNAQGMTIVLVTHQMWFVQTLCSRAICLDHGQVLIDGDPLPVIGAYRHRREGPRAGVTATSETAATAAAAEILSLEIHPYGTWATPREALPQAGVTVHLTVQLQQLPKVRCYLRVTGTDGTPYYTVYSDVIEVPADGHVACQATIPQLMLLPGEYQLWVGVCAPEGEEQPYAEEKVPLAVTEETTLRRPGCVWNYAEWTIDSRKAEEAIL